MADADAKPAKRAIPRYLQVAGELREAIMDGRFSGGAQFPTETVLCEQYDVSRFTIREALKRLQAEGLIARKRGSGTTVQPAAARGGALHQPLSNVGELLQYARDSEVKFEPTGRGPLPPEVSEQIAEDTSGDWSSFSGTRRLSTAPRPIAMTDAYLGERLAEIVPRIDTGADTLFGQIEKLAGISVGRVTQDIQAVAADARIAAALEIDEGDPVLRILRCYLDPKGNLFEISVSHHPGNRFAYAMHIDVEG